MIYLFLDMDQQPPGPNPVKGRIIRFVVYMIVGFLCAFLYGQWKD
jgi:hypothetical protein